MHVFRSPLILASGVAVTGPKRHEKRQFQKWDDGMKWELDLCKKPHACFAKLDEKLLGCRDELANDDDGDDDDNDAK